ncbi:MAG: radical SAM protein [Desulfovibrio sp.]|nr:radical SAM protein [Desulfovibrio sp.]
MHFSSGINRPPYEADDAFLQVTSGCSHGRCEFCSFYKDAPFRVSPMEEVESDIHELASTGIPFRRVFLQGADPFILPYDKLMCVAELIHTHMPSVQSIGGYARVDNIRNKSVSQLAALKDAGYGNFYFGNESGDDAILDRMNKGYHADFVVEMLQRLDKAGMDYIMNFLGGLGGHGYGLSHAQKSADVINLLHPTMVYASELTLFPDTPLSQDVQAGKFAEATEVERLEELLEFVGDLRIPTVFKAEHVTIPVPIRGSIPDHQERMCDTVRELIVYAKQGRFDAYRSQVRGL